MIGTPRSPHRPAGFRAGEFASGIAIAAGIHVLLVPVLFTIGFVIPSGEFSVSGIGWGLNLWVAFVIITAVIVGVLGWPVALGVASLLRPVRAVGVHLLAHGLAALAVCFGLATVVAGRVLVGDATLVIWAAWWPVVVSAVVSVCGAWLVVARRVRRADAGVDLAQLRSASIDSSTASSGSGRA